MEKHCNEEEKLIRDIIEKSGLETPSAHFSAAVMKQIEASASVVTATPLISPRGWFLCTLLFVGSVVLLYYFPISNLSITENLGISLEPLKVDSPTFTLSKKAFYACSFLALFLIQIPFLKQFLTKQYMPR